MSRSSFKRPRLEESSTVSSSSSSTSIVPLSLSTSYDPQDDDEDDRSSNSGDDDFEFGEGYQDHAGPSGGDDDDDDGGEGGWSEDEEEGGRRSGKGTPAKGHHPSSSRPTTPSSASKRTPTKRKATTTPKKSPKSPSSSKKTAAKPTAGGGPFVRLTPSDAYFTSISAKLSLSSLSSNIFSSLLPPLTHQSYTSLLANSSSSTKHAQELDDLAAEHERRWDGWVAELRSGWNLLFYGLGSKREGLNDFAVERLSEEGDVVVVNGLYPRIGIREILGTIEEQFPEINKMDPPPPAFSSSSSSSTTSPLDVLAYKIYTYYLPPTPSSSRSNGPSTSTSTSTSPSKPRRGASNNDPQPSASKPLFLLLHSFDSPSLRNPLSKTILSLLASNPRIHLLASIDNIHAPSLFSTTDLHSRQHPSPPPPPPPPSSSSQPSQPYLPPPERGFSFLWHDLTTLRPYTEEVSWRTSSASRLSSGVAGSGAGGIGGGSGTATEEGARHILVSVTGAAKKLFRLLATNQIAAQSSSNASSSSSSKPSQTPTTTTTTTTPSYATETSLFYHQCSTSWIAREETRFRALLAEFRDHRLILESTVAPSSNEADDDAAGGAGGSGGVGAGGGGGGRGKANARWLWIPLGKEALERLVGEIGED
ncbi:origin recognition complex subunit 2-domain-containing protein [Mrakia frigida]|uniref:origin recognition complex subunit 2 n=1 Tax=Mrakia frigida TaxID=29902 RepID=UPI003FCC249D